MDKRILYGGAAALAAYFWWASRSSSAAAATTGTRTPSTTPNGVGFNAANLGAIVSSLAGKPATVTDATATSPPTPTAITTGPAPATSVGFGPGEVAGYQSPPNSGYVSAGGIPINDATAVGRFDSINAYINTLDWSADNKAASSAALAQAANQYGVSQAEIAIASGYKQSDVEALLAGQNVARF